MSYVMKRRNLSRLPGRGDLKKSRCLKLQNKIRHTIVNYLSRQAIQGLICSYKGKNLAVLQKALFRGAKGAILGGNQQPNGGNKSSRERGFINAL